MSDPENNTAAIPARFELPPTCLPVYLTEGYRDAGYVAVLDSEENKALTEFLRQHLRPMLRTQESIEAANEGYSMTHGPQSPDYCERSESDRILINPRALRGFWKKEWPDFPFIAIADVSSDEADGYLLTVDQLAEWVAAGGKPEELPRFVSTIGEMLAPESCRTPMPV